MVTTLYTIIKEQYNNKQRDDGNSIINCEKYKRVPTAKPVLNENWTLIFHKTEMKCRRETVSPTLNIFLRFLFYSWNN